MVTTSQHEPWFINAGRLFYDGWNFAQFVTAFTFGAWASQVTGIRWSTPLGPWLFVIAAVVWGVVVVRSARCVANYVRLVADPPSPQLEILSSGTDKAVLEIAHFGAPITFRAEGRVVRALSATDTPRPPEQRFVCELQPEEGRRNATRLRLRNGEWAHIVIAESRRASEDDDGHVLWIRRGSHGRRAIAPDSGVEMEFTIQVQPGYPVGTITRRVSVSRNGCAVNAVFVVD